MVRIWCIVVGHDLSLLSPSPIEITAPPETSLFVLKKLVKEKQSDILANVNTTHLSMWRFDKPEPWKVIKKPQFLQTLTWVTDDDDIPAATADRADDAINRPTVTELDPTMRLGKLDTWLKDHEDYIHVLVREPAPAQGSDIVIDESLIILRQEYKDLFVKVTAWEKFMKADVALNRIKPWPDVPVPEFVREYEEKLDRLVPLPSNNTFARLVAEQGPAPIQTAYYADHEATPDDTPPRSTDSLEANHACMMATPAWEQGMARDRFRENKAYALFFELLFLSQEEDDQAIYCRSGAEQWDFSIVVAFENFDTPETLARYTFKSDYAIMKSRYPRYLAEVQSAHDTTNWPEDHIRLLLQGAVLVRFANRFFKLFKEERNFVLECTYFRENGMATRYLLFQKKNQEEDGNIVCEQVSERLNSSQVYYKCTRFDLKETTRRLAYGRQLYNLTHMLRAEESDPLEPFKAYKETVDRAHRYLPSLTSRKSKSKGTKNKRRRVDGGGGGDGDGDGDDNKGDGAGAGAAESGEFRAHGYELEPARGVIVLEKGGIIEPFYQLPPNIRIVHRGGKKLIAKKVRANSDEVAILKLLESTRPKSVHIISLLDSFHTQSGQWIILPKFETVMTYISRSPDCIRRKVSQICWDLIKGLAHLHKFFIAHRDIKPDNLVLDMNAGCCLKIIDFGLAMQMNDENEKVDDMCGAETWMAPEVEEETSGPYSPIKADRWACGRFILYVFSELGEKDNVLEAIGRRLKADDPQQRPSLLGLHKWTSNGLKPDNKVVPQCRPHAVESAEAINAKRFKGMAPQTSDRSIAIK